MSETAQWAAVAGAAAAALVAEMARDGWSAMRATAARFFRHGGEVEEQRQLARLDADRVHAAALDAVELQERWQRRLLTLVEDFPEAADDLSALADLAPSDGQRGGVSQSATGNSGPVMQVGRDNSGAFHTGRPRR